jgi:hypothetical protein
MQDLVLTFRDFSTTFSKCENIYASNKLHKKTITNILRIMDVAFLIILHESDVNIETELLNINNNNNSNESLTVVIVYDSYKPKNKALENLIYNLLTKCCIFSMLRDKLIN